MRDGTEDGVIEGHGEPVEDIQVAGESGGAAGIVLGETGGERTALVILILFGLPVLVRATYGVKVVVPAFDVSVVAGEFVPHQLLVAVMVVWLLFRFAPPVVALLLAMRLKLMVSAPAPLLLPEAMPPPFPLVELPVIVTFVSVVESCAPVLR